MLLVLSGSHQSVMREIVGAHGPLFGRTTLRFDLQPLDYYEAGKFVPGWSPEDRIRAYAVVGGIPEYLRHLDDDRTLRWNIERLAFEPEGPFLREVDCLFESEFREVSRRGSIFRAIARGSVRPNDIAHAVGLGGAADVIPSLRDLVELGLLERVVPITDRDVMRARHVTYRIADPYLRFYFSIVEPRRAEITVSRPAQVSEGLTERSARRVRQSRRGGHHQAVRVAPFGDHPGSRAPGGRHVVDGGRGDRCRGHAGAHAATGQ